ncbi:alkaline phosphatase family protein [Actinophytocola xinjiangensis]|uniref:alkaline phosphatase family protein n=1 Tax=Actinophytocola xinjiangensis TaxID=485602 RepID=UPI0009FF8809|nr:alkaline phosphatase family protein [Actinophytocola xinjiangensis]
MIQLLILTHVSRLFVLGIDGLPPTTLDRFLAEGLLPNCAKLLQTSARLSVTPTLPAVTSPGWMTIASGAHPATHGVVNLLQPTPGEAPDSVRNGFDRRLVKAEYLWEVLAEHDRPAMVVKYPGSWPPQNTGFVQVDGAGGYADITCRFEALPSAAYMCGVEAPQQAAGGCCAVPRGFEEHYRIDSNGANGHITVHARKPLGWSDLPAGCIPEFESTLPVQPSGQQRRELLHALAYPSSDGARLLIRRRKSDDGAVADLAVGQWSDWIREEGHQGAFMFRVKLLELDLTNRIMRIYRTEGHRVDGFTTPSELASELVDAAGPPCEWTGTFDYMNGLLDIETQLEVYDAHTAWLERTIRHLAGNPWDGFFVHWHVVEYAHHIAGSCLDDSHPLADRDRDRYLGFLRETYRLMDRLVGTVLDCVEADDGVALVSDHGHDLVHTMFHVNDFFREQGWLVAHEHDDSVHIDWSKSRAYALFPGLVVLNRESWWSGGIVHEDEVGGLVEEITAGLRGLVDPRTGQPVVTGVLDADEMATYGQSGEHAPDLFFSMARGYEPATRLRAGREPYFVLTEPGVELTSGHGSFHPASPSARTLALLRHPSLEPGSVGQLPVAMVDLAPTFAQLLGVRAPRDADGRPLNLHALGVLREQR